MASPAELLERVGERVYRVPGAVNVAIAVHQGLAVVIDSGQDDGYGRRIRRALEELSATPVAIVNTHAHADHYGGNHYLLRRFDVPVFAPPFEDAIMANPLLQPIYLFHGARPPEELRSKWLLAKPSRVDRPLQPGPLEIAGIEMEVLDTSGHAHVQRSLRIDEVLVAADAAFGPEVLARYPLPFAQDVSGQVESLERVENCGARVALPGHGEPCRDLASLVAANLQAIERAAEAVEKACVQSTTEEVLAGVCLALDIRITDLPRYYLNLCTVAAYLGYLRASGRVGVTLVGGVPRWTRSPQPSAGGRETPADAPTE